MWSLVKGHLMSRLLVCNCHILSNLALSFHLVLAGNGFVNSLLQTLNVHGNALVIRVDINGFSTHVDIALVLECALGLSDAFANIENRLSSNSLFKPYWLAWLLITRGLRHASLYAHVEGNHLIGMSESNIVIPARARASHLACFLLSQQVQILPLFGLSKVTMDSHECNRKPRGPILEGGHALITNIPMGKEVGLINRGHVTGAR